MIEFSQEDALQILEDGDNIFLTGAAGSGKTYLIQKFIKTSNKNIAITATTGIAALNIKGDTVHRFLKLGILTRPKEAYRIISKWEAIKKSSKPWDKVSWDTLKNLDTLVIDEASMLRRDQFELIDVVLSNVLENNSPFGGLQIILVGDFFQLPPVITEFDRTKYRDLKAAYCFQSPLWKQGKFLSISLNTNYRQSDPTFLNILNKVRIGNIDAEVNKILTDQMDHTLNESIKPVKLFPFKKEVNVENKECLKQLNKDILLSEAEYSGKQYDVDLLKKDCQAEDKLFFAEGAQIMMLTNDPDGKWVNGTMGTILGANPVKIKLSSGLIIYPTLFKWERTINTIKNNKVEQKSVASMTQYPFKLAYAASIHKSQGLTLDYVDVDISNCFAPGQVYVALSRVKNLDGLVLKGWSDKIVKVDQDVERFYKNLC